MTPLVSQNIYDNDAFYEAYRQLPRSVEGLPGAPEWPSVRSLLPDLEGARVLDLGCGLGAFGRWAASAGASRIIGIDLSVNMLRRARELTDSDAIEYRLGDLAALDVPERGFDLIYSALAFHYVEDFPGLCAVMRTKLKDGGRLVASVEHPIFSAPSDDRWQDSAQGGTVWPLDNYLNEGARERTWFVDGVVRYHRTIEAYVRALLENSFRLSGLIEWGPDATQIAAHPQWARERDRPMFLIFAADAE